MQPLQIEKANALNAYKKANTETKAVLEALLGKEVFSEKITDRVKTFEDALALEQPSDNVKKLLDYNGQDKQMISTQAHAKLSIIAKALNEGWEPDWENENEYKYWPWLKYTAGVGFSCHGCVCGASGSSVGSRLCFKSRELAEYAARQFESIYNDFFN